MSYGGQAVPCAPLRAGGGDHVGRQLQGAVAAEEAGGGAGLGPARSPSGERGRAAPRPIAPPPFVSDWAGCPLRLGRVAGGCAPVAVVEADEEAGGDDDGDACNIAAQGRVVCPAADWADKMEHRGGAHTVHACD